MHPLPPSKKLGQGRALPQGRFEFDNRVKIKKPLLCLATVAAECAGDTDCDELLAAVESGVIRWAWNIGSEAAETRKEIRILRHSAEHYQNTGGFRDEPDLTWDQVIAMALPNRGDTFEAKSLMSFWCSSSQLGLTLLAEHAFQSVVGVAPARGPKSSPLITRSSIIKFLHRRRIL